MTDRIYRHERGNDRLNLAGGGLCLSLVPGDSFFIELSADRALQVQLIEVAGRKVKLRFAGDSECSIAREQVVLDAIAAGGRFSTVNARGKARGKALENFLRRLVAVFSGKGSN